MKKKIILSTNILIIGLLLSTYASAGSKITYHEEPTGVVSDEVYRIRIDWSDIVKTPSWMPGENDEPPFGLKQAVQNAKDYVQQNLSQFSNSFVKSVTLNCFYSSIDGCKDKWFYLVSFNNFNSKNTEHPYLFESTANKKDISIIVMMDGNVPDVLVEKRTQPRDVYTIIPADRPTSGPRAINTPIPATTGSSHIEN